MSAYYSVYGAVIVDGLIYEDQAITSLAGRQFGKLGADWKFAGDQGDDEADIFVEILGAVSKDFAGETALPDFLAWLVTQGE